MEKISISGMNKSVRNCLDCGRLLTTDEYNTCRNRCAGCHSKIHDKKYIHSDGSNDVDKILQNKNERR